MTKRRVVVTGAGGLIGRAVTRRLVEMGDSVVAVVRPDGNRPADGTLQLLALDLRSPLMSDLHTLGRFDAVIHLAQAPGWHEFPHTALDIVGVNVAATIALAQAAAAAGAAQFIYASSGGIYGPSAFPLNEDQPFKPAAELGFYLATKVAAERLLTYFAGKMQISVLRPFFVYGPGQASSFIIPRLIEAVRAGRSIRVDGGRGSFLNPIWVEDAAAAFIAALNIDQPLVANVAGPEVLSVRALAETIGKHIGREPIFETNDQLPDDYMADTAVMGARLGLPQVRLADGIMRWLAAEAPETST